MKPRAQRLQIMLSPEELELVDSFRFANRMPSRSAAVRELLNRGLASVAHVVDPTGTKSKNIGVFGRGDNSYDGNG